LVIFIDTSALIALVDDQDVFHANAIQQWRILLENQETLLCNNYVVLETMSLIQRRFGMRYIDLLNSEFLYLLKLHWIDEEEHHSVVQTFLEINRRNLSLVDCSSFSTMRQLGIQSVFTFDLHFREQGFHVIP
jgi:predicted nucleic acid-binding protein